MSLLILGVIAVALILYAISVYNSLQTTLTRITAAIQEIGNQLKRQASLIPNLESSVKGYLKHEKDIFKELTSARKMVDSAVKDTTGKSLDKVEEAINSLAGRLQVVVESNPQIKGDTVVTNLMNELRDTSDKLMYARRAVIDLTAQFNQMLVTIPSNFVAKMFGFKSQPGLATPNSGAHLEVGADEMNDPKVSI